MRGYLLDTNVISDLAPGRPIRNEACVRWLETRADALFLSVVTIVEIEAGITLVQHRDARQKATLLPQWLDAILHFYSDRILPFDAQLARAAGRLSGTVRVTGLAPG